MQMTINIVGGGLAGCECAYFLAEHGVKVNLYEMKPKKFSPAHHSENLAEIVCSNSLKNTDVLTSSGLLKYEMETIGSLILKVAKNNQVPAGGALAVDRDKFSTEITRIINEHKNITILNQEITDVDIKTDDIWVFATGPLTSDKLNANIQKMLGFDNLHFYDASAPIVTKESLDLNKCFKQNRYGEAGEGDYLNAVLTKDEYYNFVNELINAEVVQLHSFEKAEIFEGCMPIEVMAKRGIDALRFGPMKPTGLNKNSLGVKPYAVVQLRKENTEEETFNMVGFQTNLKFGEQKRVFSLIPAFKNAEFIKYGVMHKNTFICAPKCLNIDYSLRANPNIYFAGQLSGVEGYVESTASGLIVAISIYLKLHNRVLQLNSKTMIGAIAGYISNPSNASNFQPMNSNYGIIGAIDGKFYKKEDKRQAIFDRSKVEIQKLKEIIESGD